MTACHDPYRELEIYLEKAQEEIGKAFEELLQHEKDSPHLSCDTLENVDTVLPPPPAFRSSSLSSQQSNNFTKNIPRDKLDCNTMSRVCYDGNVLDLRDNSSNNSCINHSSYLLQKSFSCPSNESYFPKLDKDIREANVEQTFTNGGLVFSNHEKLLSKQLRPSLSFPEGAIDNFLREKVLSAENSFNNGKETAQFLTKNNNGRSEVVRKTEIQESTFIENGRPRLRLRSFSGTSSSVDPALTINERYYTFPRPPSGDVNLLSIWADNLVLAVDKSLSEEFDDSVGSSSPLSDYSPSPNKQDEENISYPFSPVETTSKPLSVDGNMRKDGIVNRQRNKAQLNFVNNSFKMMSPSPDSGICNTPDAGDDVVDFVKFQEGACFDASLSLRLKIDLLQNNDNFDITHCITPPPPEFEDKDTQQSSIFSHVTSNESELTSATESLKKHDAETQVNRPVLRAASNIMVVSDDNLELQSVKRDHRQARVVPLASVDVEENPTITTVCVVNEIPSYYTCGNHSECEAPSTEQRSVLMEVKRPAETTTIFKPSSSPQPLSGEQHIAVEGKLSPHDSVQPGNISSSTACTLPKLANRVNESERYSCSLPRDAGRIPSAIPPHSPQRSSSSSAVSSISQVSVDELAAFMRKVKKSTYHPPPRADVCIDAKDDNDQDSFSQDESNRDAVTQTTPVVPLSRSSSFTWVTECDCSDWDSSNARSTSEDSLLVFSCSNSDPEKKEAQTSSSLSSSADDDVFDAPQNSACSSLYLSACSEAGDSRTSGSSPTELGKQELTECNETSECERLQIKQESTVVSPVLDLAASESIKSLSSVGTLVDIMEESPTNETLSFCSVSSNSDTMAKEQPASFPSTLKSNSRARTSESEVYRNQPIEANVLIVNELNVKSVSAPVLRQKRHMAPKMETSSLKESSPSNAVQFKSGTPFIPEAGLPLRAHSAKELNELQAIEACSWLRAAGFPQYAQMYDDNLFPIDICTVQKDHAFLHPDSIQSLFRRLNTLNRCARMKLTDTVPRKSLHLDDSDDEEQCALSENWQFQRISRRWSRVSSPAHASHECTCGRDHSSSPKPNNRSAAPGRKYLTPEEAYTSSHDSVFLEDHHSSPDSIRKSSTRSGEYLPVLALREGGNSPGSSSGSGGTLSVASEDVLEKRWDIHQKNLHRSGSDRIKEGAKALLRRMESLKGKRKKKAPSHVANVSAKVNSGTDGSSCSSLTPSPLLNRQHQPRFMNPQDMSDVSQGGTPEIDHRKKGFSAVYKEEAGGSAHSDSECPMFSVSELWRETMGKDVKRVEQRKAHQTKVKSTSNSQTTSCGLFNRGNLKKKIQKGPLCSSATGSTVQKKKSDVSFQQDTEKLSNRASHYDNLPAPLAVFNSACVEGLDRDLAEPGKSDATTNPVSDQGSAESNEGEIIIINNERRDSGVGASLTRDSSYCYAPWHSFPQHSRVPKPSHSLIPITDLSAPQILLLRKLSLIKLTALMEKFSPSSRTGWSWAVPKFIRRIRTPDYKDKVVFGVPLLLVLQRTGQPLPASIQEAIHYLRKTALDSTGLFRKSGVRSRIQKLRNLSENNPGKVNYEDQQAYDVADLLKQYFRELPEALLTNKLSETFISIFQYIPEEQRLEAIQAAILLMPDENREVLQALLSFLQEVCQHSRENQMTATNLAVCFAPSLFHLTAPRSASASPRRRKTVGAPDLKELNENRAAYECLSSMVVNYNELCSVPEDLFSQSGLSYMDTSEPAKIEELADLVSKDAYGWGSYTNGCIQALLKEAKEKFKGWVSVSQSDGVDLSYKKAGDCHPLRLWKVSTEVEAPPTELLNRILRERHIWDPSFMKWRVVQTLDKQTEIFQFVSSTLLPHPPCDYCVIRSWRTELQKGACVLIEASVDHPEAKIMIDGVRAIILASRFLIEPCGSGKSRITHISRVDTRGRSPEWYNRAYGHICTLNLIKLRDSFSHVRTEGPETKV